MSRANINSTYRRTSATARANKPAPREEISRIDAQIKHLIDNVLPKTPYILSVPSDVPYRHNSRFVNNWHLGTHFAREEEPLQYMSFLTHQDEEQSLIKAVGGWSDEKGNLVDEDPSPQQIYGSTSTSPSLAAQRKKISLLDYKSKAKGGEEPSKPDSMGQSGQTESKSKKTQANGTSPEEAKKKEVKAGPSVTKTQEKKRSFGEIADSSSKIKSPKPEKRARSKSPVRAKSPRSPARDMDRVNHTITRVPLLLSPTLPPSNRVTSIPELLSPTLPSSIEEFLAQDSERESNRTTKHERSDSVRSILGTAGLDKSPLSASKKSGMVRTNHERHLSPSIQVDLKEAKTSPGARGRDSTSSPGPRRRHVIVLKYGKRNKKRVEALLKFAPRNKKQIPKLEPSSELKHEQVEMNGASRRDKGGPTSHPSEPPLKRPKTTPSTMNFPDRPSTPVPPGFKSPSIQNSLQPRSTFTTPRKELKTTAMRRVESSEGLDVGTPTASVTRQSTPNSMEKPQISARPTSPSDLNSLPPSSNHADTRRAWKALHAKYYELGRTLKHEGQSLLQQQQPPQDPQAGPHDSSIVGVLLTIEALLCFMLNQTFLSYANSHTDPGWRTILPYLSFVLRISKPFPALFGLVSQLGAVCRQTISRYDLDRLAREPLPTVMVVADEHKDGSNVVNSAPTPGSDGNTKTTSTAAPGGAGVAVAGNEDPDKARRRWNILRSELIENSRDLQRAWLDGYQKLGPELLKTQFPDTWARRARDEGGRSSSTTTATSSTNAAGAGQQLTPENWSTVTNRHQYFLPLDPNSTPLEAVRYARALLVEWEGARKMQKGDGGAKAGAPGWKSRLDF